MSAEAALIEIKVRRAEARQETEIVVLLLKELVEAREKELETARIRYRTGKVTASDVSDSLKAVLEAKVRLNDATSDE